MQYESRITTTKSGKTGEIRTLPLRSVWAKENGFAEKPNSADCRRAYSIWAKKQTEEMAVHVALHAKGMEIYKVNNKATGGMTVIYRKPAKIGAARAGRNVIDLFEEIKKAGIQLSPEQLAVLTNRDNLVESLAV